MLNRIPGMSCENVSTGGDEARWMLYPRLVAVNGSLLLLPNPVDPPVVTPPIVLTQRHNNTASLMLRIIVDGLALAGTSMYLWVEDPHADDT